MEKMTFAFKAMMVATLVAITAFLVTFSALSDKSKEVAHLQEKLSLCQEEKVELMADTASLRSHANNSFEAMSVFLERLIQKGDGGWVAERLGLGSVSKQEGRSHIIHYHAEDMAQ